MTTLMMVILVAQLTVWQTDGQFHHLCRSTPKGTEYRGKINVTNTGKTCQKWTSQYPHVHNQISRFPATGEDMGDAENYCRNVDDETALWCYTTDPAKKFEYCDVPYCCILVADLAVPDSTRKAQYLNTSDVLYGTFNGSYYRSLRVTSEMIKITDSTCATLWEALSVTASSWMPKLHNLTSDFIMTVKRDLHLWPIADPAVTLQQLIDLDSTTCLQLDSTKSMVYMNMSVPEYGYVTVIVAGQNICNSCNFNVLVTDSAVNFERKHPECGITCGSVSTCVKKKTIMDSCTYKCYCPYTECKAVVISYAEASSSLCEVTISV